MNNSDSQAKAATATRKLVRLGEVALIIAGQSPPGDTYSKLPEGLPFFQGKADFGKLHPVPRVYCTAPLRIAEPGDILISVRAPVGPTNVADVKCCIGRGLAAIRVRPEAERDFVLWLLRHREKELAELGAGSTFQAINRDDLESLSFKLPNLDEQRLIVTRLNEQMSNIETVRTSITEQARLLNYLTAALLDGAFEGS